MITETLENVFYLNQIYISGGELLLEMTQVYKDGNDSISLIIYSDKANDLVYNKRHINSTGHLEEEKGVKLLKPYIIERTTDGYLFVSISDSYIKFTDKQYEYLIDYINSKKISASTISINEAKRDDELYCTMKKVLKELRKINRKLDRIDNQSSKILEDVKTSISRISNELDSVDETK